MDEELRKAEAELARGDADSALARMARIEEMGGAPAPAAPGKAPLQRANTMAANKPAQLQRANTLTSLPRDGTLVKLVGDVEIFKALGLEKYRGRMGRTVEMVGKSYMQDGITELATILLDARNSDYFGAQGAWVQVPLGNLQPM